MASSSLRYFGPFRLDTASACLWRHDQLLPLSPKPFAVLAHLVAHGGEVVTKEALLDAVWPETAVSEGVLKTCIGQIRQALGDTAQTPHYIETIHRRGYRFIAPVSLAVPTQTASGAPPPAGQPSVPPVPGLVAREPELAALNQRWAEALQHRRQIVFVTGEAGIGKTALIDAFVAQVTSAGGVWTARGQCIEQYGSGEAYLPLLEAIGQLGRGPDSAQVIELLRRQAPSWLLQMPALLSGDEYETLQRRSSGATRERMLRELAEAMESLTAERPLVLVLEDLHWSDYATLDWLAFVARHRAPARLLVLGTYRPADAIVRAHPVHTVAQELQRQGRATERVLPYLSAVGVAAYLAQRFGAVQLQPEFMRVLHQRTNGNPFFLVTVVDELMRQGLFEQTDHGLLPRGDPEAIAGGVPESVRQLIDQQLTHLEPDDLELLEAASVAGVEFSAAAVAAGVDRTIDDVEERCDALGRRRQIVQPAGVADWPDGTVAARYRFMHDLYYEVFYDRVPPSRRARWHRQIGSRLETAYGSQAPHMATELAMHFVRGRDTSRAVRYLRYAGEQALRRSAHQEAIGHLRQSLELLRELPETPERAEQELAVQTILCVPLVATRSITSPEVGQAYQRAWELCQHLGDTSHRLPVLLGLYRFYTLRGEFQHAQDLEEQILALAQAQQDTACRIEVHRRLGVAQFHRGAFATALAHCQQTTALYDPRAYHPQVFVYGWVDAGVSVLGYAAYALWCLGYPDQALRQAQASLRLAAKLAHPLSLAFAHHFLARVHQHRGEVALVQEHSAQAIAISTEYQFAARRAAGTVLHGWALAAQGQVEAGLAQMQQGLDETVAMQAGIVTRPYFLALVAETYGRAGQAMAGVQALDRALAMGHRTQDYEAELHRLKGNLLGQAACSGQRTAVTPEACFQQALAIARRQEAKSLELRAALSLSRWWQQQGRRDDARVLLAEAFGWFGEGFDTADLRDAKALLDALIP
jgi:DNA-binding winged helix-turn-helix (wHTH) protein/predicted ATPase